MSIEDLTKLVGELAEVIEFHELHTVDLKAAELLIQARALEAGVFDGESLDAWLEELRIANLVDNTR